MHSREHDQLKLFSYSSHLNAFFRDVDNFLPPEGTRQVNPFRQTFLTNVRSWVWSGIFKWIDRVTDLCNWPLQKMPWPTILLFVGHFKILHKHCLHFLFGVKMAPKETENIAYAKFWGNKKRALWYVTVFSVVVDRAFSHDGTAAI